MLPLVGILPQASSLLRSREMSHGSQVGHLCLVPATTCILKVDEALLGLLMPLGSSLDVGIQRTLDLPVLELQSSHASVEDVQCDLRANRGWHSLRI